LASKHGSHLYSKRLKARTKRRCRATGLPLLYVARCSKLELGKTLGTKNSALEGEKGGFNRRALEGWQNRSSIPEVNVMDEKAKETTDQPVRGHIERVVAEEHKLYNQATLGEEDRARLAKIKVELDQCWDLLRQRHARREFGQDFKAAHVRAPDVVENYEG
jgi:hypothetical protein